MKELDAVIFDLDECLVDSEPMSLEALASAMRAGGIAEATTEEMRDKYLGVSVPESSQQVADRLVGMSPDALVTTFHRRLFEAYASGVPRIDSMVALLDRLQVDGIATCIASGGSPERILRTLQGANLSDRFGGRMFSAEEVPRGKPAPDLFLEAARRLDVSPVRCVVIEDSPHGIRGAVAAGMRAIGFTGGGHLDRIREAHTRILLDAGADHVVRDGLDIVHLILE